MGDSPEIPIPQEGSETLNPEWKESIRIGIEDVLDSFGIVLSDIENPAEPLDFSPVSLTNSDEDTYDDRGYDELSSEEKEFIQNEVFSALGFDSKTAAVIESYEYEAPEKSGIPGKLDPETRELKFAESSMPDKLGTVRVNIYETPRSDEGFYIHKVVYPDNLVEYIVAPQQYRL